KFTAGYSVLWPSAESGRGARRSTGDLTHAPDVVLDASGIHWEHNSALHSRGRGNDGAVREMHHDSHHRTRHECVRCADQHQMIATRAHRYAVIRRDGE